MTGRQRVAFYGLLGHVGAIGSLSLMHHGWPRDAVGFVCSFVVGSALLTLSEVRHA